MTHPEWLMPILEKLAFAIPVMLAGIIGGWWAGKRTLDRGIAKLAASYRNTTAIVCLRHALGGTVAVHLVDLAHLDAQGVSLPVGALTAPGPYQIEVFPGEVDG